MSLKSASQMVTTALLAVTFFAVSSEAAIYRIDLKNNSTVLSTRTIDTIKSAAKGGVSHGAGGIAIEVADSEVSCGVFIQAQASASELPAANVPANVMVSLIPTRGPMATRTVTSNSGLLSKLKISQKDQDVLPNSAGSRSVSVDALKLRRSCTVSVL